MKKHIFPFALSTCAVFLSTGCALTDFVGNMGLEDYPATTTAVSTAPTEVYTPTTTIPPTLIDNGMTDANYGEYKVTPPEKPTVPITAVKTISADTEVFSSENIITKDENTSAVIAREGADVTFKECTIASNSLSSSSLDTRFFGLNSALLCQPRSHVSVNGGEIGTTGKGAAGVFAYGSGAVADLSGTKISTYGALSYGIASTYKGNIFGSNCIIETTGNYSPAVYVGRNGGTINLVAGEIKSSGGNAPAVYSAGTLALTGTKVSAEGSECAVIEGTGSAMLTGCDISSDTTNTVRLFCSNSGDAPAGLTKLDMFGGSISTNTGAAFYVANTKAEIYLQRVDFESSSGSLVNAVANDKWGEHGENGSDVHITANYQQLEGDVYADNLSTVTIELTALSTLEGGINTMNTAKEAHIILDASSKWIVTGNSFVTTITPGMADFSNIIDNGYTIYYDKEKNSHLNGETITLRDGGLLTPSPN